MGVDPGRGIRCSAVPFQSDIENKDHSEFFFLGKITNISALTTHYGYETIDAQSYQFKVGQTYPKILNNFEEFLELDIKSLLSQGYTSVSVNELPKEIKFTAKPMNIMDIKKIQIPKNNSMPSPPLKLGKDATFLLYKNDQVVYAVINGFVYNVSQGENRVKNGVVK